VSIQALRATGTLISLLLCVPVAAQEAPQEQQLEGVVVTAPADSTPVTPITTRYGTQYNVITEDQITKQDSLDFPSTLRDVPGVMFQSKNLLGSQTSHSVYIRGRGASHPNSDFIVQFDGVPRYGALFGQVLGDDIAVATIGGIEVYKSPQPAQFGSGYALINVLPKFQATEGQEEGVSASGGSYGTVDQSVFGGIKRGRYDAYVAQSWTSTDGNVDHSRAQQQNYYANLGYKINSQWNVRILANYVSSQTVAPMPDVTPTATNSVSYPGAERYDTTSTFTTLTLNNQSEQATGFLKGYWNETDFDLLQELTNGHRYAGGTGGLWSRQEIQLYGVRGKEALHLWPGGEILAGTDVDMTTLRNTERTYTGQVVPGINGGLQARVWDFPDTTLVSPYVGASQVVGQTDGFHVTPSAAFRYFFHNQFRDAPSYQAGLVAGYALTDLHFNYARGVNYPSPIAVMNLVLVSAPVSDPSQYWKSLKPELVDHYEVGLTHRWPQIASLGATAFYDRGKDRLQAYMFGPIPPVFNDPIGKYEIRGLELNGTATPVSSLELFAGATWLDAKATGNNGISQDRLPYTPGFQLQAGFTWRFLEHFQLYADVEYLRNLYAGTSSRTGTFNFSALPDSSRLDDITLANARLSYRFAYEPWRLRDAEVFVVVNNLLDQEYEYAKGYPMPKTTVFAGLSAKFH
jgi:iron complex outermembrane receptor protein